MRLFQPALTAILIAIPVASMSPVISPALAQGTLQGQLQQCLGVFGAVERLACYDRVARGVNPQGAPQSAPNAVRPYAALPPTPAQPAVAAVPAYAPPATGFGYSAAAPARQTTPDQFGAENIPRPAVAAAVQRPIESLSGAVTAIAYTPQGRFIVTLANGQVWQQLEGDVSQPNLRRKVTRTVTISRGLLGSYNLVFSDQRGLFKVNRVR